MDRISPSEGGGAGSIPAEGTESKKRPFGLFLIEVPRQECKAVPAEGITISFFQ